jgi:RNA polymerase sigma-70 factor, ECF subfamily
MDTEAAPELIARARYDRTAFGELYDLYLPRVFGFCRKYSRTREEAEDLTAETFMRALSAMPRYEDRGVPLSGWLLRIARNVILNHVRARGREIGTADPAGRADESDLEDWEEASWLRAHLDALPHDQRMAVRLRFYEDLRIRDMAEHMRRSEGAIKQLLRRALQALHLQIQREAEENAGHE